MIKIKHIPAIVLSFVLLNFAGCSNDDPTDPEIPVVNEQLNALMNNGNSWVLGNTGSVLKDDVDVSVQFSEFELNIGNKTYTTQNSLAHVWATSGTWDFLANEPDMILKDGGVEISFQHLNDNLTLTLTAPGSASGRTTSVSGKYVFNLVSK